MYDRRFASLRGHARELLEEELDDLLDVEEEPGPEAVFRDPPHDGWSEIRPTYERMLRAHRAATHPRG